MTEYDETRCLHWPNTCAEVQAQCPTFFKACDFCLYGPAAEPPRRDVGDVGDFSLDEARDLLQARIQAPEQARAQKLRDAVIAAVGDSREGR